jgi:hypothetical protein
MARALGPDRTEKPPLICGGQELQTQAAEAGLQQSAA